MCDPFGVNFSEARKVYVLIHLFACRYIVVPEPFIENLLGFNQKHLMRENFSVEPITV